MKFLSCAGNALLPIVGNNGLNRIQIVKQDWSLAPAVDVARVVFAADAPLAHSLVCTRAN